MYWVIEEAGWGSGEEEASEDWESGGSGSVAGIVTGVFVSRAPGSGEGVVAVFWWGWSEDLEAGAAGQVQEASNTMNSGMHTARSGKRMLRLFGIG
jgi:hypothetical protein